VAVCFTQASHCRRHLPDKMAIGGILDIGVDFIYVRMAAARLTPLRAAATDFNHHRELIGFKSFSQAFRRGTEIEKNRDYHLCPLPQLMPKKERTI